MMRLLLIAVALGWCAFLVTKNLKWLDQEIETAAILSQSTVNFDTATPGIVSASTSKIDSLGNVQTYSRPLFNRERREFVKPKIVKEVTPEPIIEEPVEEEVPPEIIPPLMAKLIGTSGIENAMSALIILQNGGDANWYKVGEKIQDWELKEINSQSVKFKSNEQEIDLKLYEEAQHVTGN